jgi:aspartate/methionine/tyrosine aminotransferase
VSIAELHGAHLFSDEVYRFLEHGAPPLSPAADCFPHGISLGVMSKAFGLAGLRIGWIASTDASLRARLATIRDYTTICSAAPSEILALIGLRARRTLIARAMEIVRSNLALLDAFFARNDARFRWVRPVASTVGFPELIGADADEFAAELVRQEGVLILPASQFGYAGNHFRIGFGRRDLPEGLERLERFVNGG